MASTPWWYEPPGTAGHALPAAQIGTIAGVYSTANSAPRSRNTPASATSVAKLPSRGRTCCEGQSVAKLELGTAVCQIASRTCMVDGFSHSVLVRVPPPGRHVPVSACHRRTLVSSTVTATLSSFRYSIASTSALNVWSQLRVRLVTKLGSCTLRTRSGPHALAAHRRYALTR